VDVAGSCLPPDLARTTAVALRDVFPRRRRSRFEDFLSSAVAAFILARWLVRHVRV
jgi:hypothetical protein